MIELIKFNDSNCSNCFCYRNCLAVTKIDCQKTLDGYIDEQEYKDI